MSNSAQLSLEQQFNLRSFETQVAQMSQDQARDFLVKLYEEMLVRENMYKDVLKHQWGL
ncbi:MAG: NblA/ycf18 family protein [Cyanobacterium sp. T60_A2020_053]|nr:NblA/ycf18 family protein [Cyanobacterium sp. T60_A2020_053]